MTISILNIYGYKKANISVRTPVIIEARYKGEINCHSCSKVKLRKKQIYPEDKSII